MKINFPYMLVENSIWPATTSFSILSLLIGLTMTFHMKIGGTELFIVSLISLIISVYFWWREIVIEGSYQGLHSYIVSSMLSMGFLLFVLSEALIFFSFFFGYFYNSLIPSVEVGGLWPPVGIVSLDPSAIPFFNTVILFFSGVCVTASQHFIVSNNKKLAVFYLFFSILLGFIFLFLQFYEYKYSLFSIADSVFGASFFLLTGFHGSHVLIGVLFLIVSLFRLAFYHFSSSSHLNATFASIYYHFVDVVWIFLFAVIYCWGTGL